MPSPRTDIDTRSSLKSGDVVRDTYTVLDFLGKGRFADTYRVRHRYMGIQAMKVLVDQVDEEELDACFTEAFLLSKLSFPGIVRVFDANRLEARYRGFAYITMEYVDGGTLLDLIKDVDSGLIVDAALDIGIQIAHALGHAHQLERPLVHRDVKPANILLESVKGDQVRVRLADYGLARHTDLFTKTVDAGGTILYMSPESFRGFETPASDVFSLGLVLYELLTGTLPYPKHAFEDASTPQAMEKTLVRLQRAIIEPPSYFDPDIPAYVDAVVMRCLIAEEPERFQTGCDLASALSACHHANQGDLFNSIGPNTQAELMSIFKMTQSTIGFAKSYNQLNQLVNRQPDLAKSLSPHLAWMRSERDRLKQITKGSLHAAE